MSRRATFTAAEIARAVKAAKAGGMRLVRLEIETGKIIVIELTPATPEPEAQRAPELVNEWDSVK